MLRRRRMPTPTGRARRAAAARAGRVRAGGTRGGARRRRALRLVTSASVPRTRRGGGAWTGPRLPCGRRRRAARSSVADEASRRSGRSRWRRRRGWSVLMRSQAANHHGDAAARARRSRCARRRGHQGGAGRPPSRGRRRVGGDVPRGGAADKRAAAVEAAGVKVRAHREAAARRRRGGGGGGVGGGGARGGGASPRKTPPRWRSRARKDRGVRLEAEVAALRCCRGGGADGGARSREWPPAARVGGGAAAVDAICPLSPTTRSGARGMGPQRSPACPLQRLDEPTPPRVAAIVRRRHLAARREAARAHRDDLFGAGVPLAAHLPDDGLRGGGGSADRVNGAATESPRPRRVTRGESTSRVQTPRDRTRSAARGGRRRGDRVGCWSTMRSRRAARAAGDAAFTAESRPM